MSEVLSLKTPEYFHRDYENDLPTHEDKHTWAYQTQRVVHVALPFISLYKPIGTALAIGSSSSRVLSSSFELASAINEGDTAKIGKAVLNKTLAISSIAGTVFLNPLGMFITSAHDFSINGYHLYQAIASGEHDKVTQETIQLANNTLYLLTMIYGGLEIQILSLACQVVLGGYSSVKDFNEGNYLEFTGHALMAAIRVNQMYDQIQVLQYKRSLQELFSRIQEDASKTQKNTENFLPKNKLHLNKCLLATVDDASKQKTADIIIDTPKEGSTELLNVLATYGNKGKAPPLLKAVKAGDLNAVRLLVQHGEDINQITKIGDLKDCAILSALRFPKILAFLIHSGADVNIRLSFRKTPLHYAANDETMIESIGLLLQNGAEVNAKDLFDVTPLHRGIMKEKTAFLLMAYGADIHAVDEKGWKPLHHAYQTGDIPLLKELVKRGFSLTEYSPAGLNALHYACRLNTKTTQFDLIKYLVEECRMNVNAYGKWADGKTGAHTPFMLAVSSQGHHEDDFTIINYLLLHGGDLNVQLYHGTQPHYRFLELAKMQPFNYPKYVISWMTEHGAL